MKLTQKKIKKPILILIIFLSLIIGGLAYYVFVMNGSFLGWKPQSDNSVNEVGSGSLSEEQQQAGSSTKRDSVDRAAQTPHEQHNEEDENIDVIFTAINQSGGILQVRIQIDALLSGGDCELTLTKGDHQVTKFAPTHVSASVSTCQGFDIPVSELSPGTWNIIIDIKASNKTGHATATTEIH